MSIGSVLARGGVKLELRGALLKLLTETLLPAPSPATETIPKVAALAPSTETARNPKTQQADTDFNGSVAFII